MAKENLIDMVIPEAAGEKILKEGIMVASNLYYKPYLKYSYKYVLTEKGVWMRNPKVLFIKPKTSYISYNDLDCFALGKYNNNDCCIFFPKKGKPGNRIFFDDFDGAVKIFDMFIARKTD
ncbi:MAG: hypothetical protein LBN07_03035 [Christensenellaceae bacterium]|jgi:hypothetical protein|nr:hypothetical protein [Christensenellaceae bacterium]